MRDLILAGFLFGSIPFILWRPAIGVFLWVWVSVMNPHRLTWGFAYDYPFAQLVAIATLAGMLFASGPKRLPLTRVTVTLMLLALWMNFTTLFALDVAESLPMWERVMKIQLMVFVSLYLLHSKQHVQWLIWILAGSVAFFGAKGGAFTLLTGGEFRVWGPPGSFIEENNSLALATIMTIPLLYYLFRQSRNRWLRWGLLGVIALCALSALGSYSRGAFVAITAVLGFLWWKSRSKFLTAIAVALMATVALSFMPDRWHDRMESILTYDQDSSALGRMNSWMMAINLANDRPLVGGGFEIYNENVFARYAPDPSTVRSAHSIYFQMLGEHGYVGLMLFLLLWFLIWRDASWIIRHTRDRTDLRWAHDLARMSHVSLVGYAVGGAFLNLAYFDVPYYLVVALVVTRLLVEKGIEDVTPAQDRSAGPLFESGIASSPWAVSKSKLDNRGYWHG